MEIEPEPEPVPQPEPEPEPEPVGDRLVGRKTPAGVWVGEGAPSALHDELHGMEARKAQLQREIEEMEEAQAKQMATMLQQRSNLKSSMDAMDLQKVAAETAANDAKKAAAAHKATYDPPTVRQETMAAAQPLLRPETLPVPNDPPAWAPDRNDAPFHSGGGGSIASRQAANALADNERAVHDWREEREDTLLSLARRPLDLWRPTGPPPPQSLEDLDAAGGGTMEAEPLSLRWLSEHALDAWNETAFPTHPAPGGGSGRGKPKAEQEIPVQKGPSDALLVFRAAFTDWLSEQTDKRGTVPGTSIKLITPDELHLLAQTARGYLGMELMPDPVSGQRNITAVELCEHLRPARRRGEDPNTNARDLAGDASALKEYLTGGTGAGEADLHRLMDLAPPPGSDAAKQAVDAAQAARSAALRASTAARAAMADSEAAERELRAASEAALDAEHRLAKEDPDFGARPHDPAVDSARSAGDSSARGPGSDSMHAPSSTAGSASAAPESDAQSEQTGEKRHLLRHFILKMIILPRQTRDKHRENSKNVAFLSAAMALGNFGGSGAVAKSLVPGERDGMSIPAAPKANDKGETTLLELGIIDIPPAPEPELEPEPEPEPEPLPDLAWFTACHPDLKVSNPELFQDQPDENGWSEMRCGT